MSARFVAGALAAAAFALAAPCALAQAAAEKKTDKPAEAMVPKPAAEMSNLAFFEGSWSCSGEGAMEPGGPMMKMNSSVEARSGLGGFWQVGTVKVPATGGMPAFEGMFHTTWDPAAKQYVMLWVDNMGGWSTSRAPGWVSDAFVYTGEGQMGDKKMATRDTFTRKADGSMVHLGEMQVEGKWVKAMEETCKKAGAR